jgi:hypothetical protein
VDEGDRRGVDRLTIQEAARALGISEGAVRKRVTRGTLKHKKEQDGRIYIYLDEGDRRGVDFGQDTRVDPDNSALISQLRDEVAYLRDESRRKDEIIMQQAMTMRQLTAAQRQEPTEAAETVEEEPEGSKPPPREPEPSEALDQEQEGLAGLVVERAGKVSKAKGPPVLGQDSVLADSTLLTSIVPLPVEYEPDPYMPRYVRDRRVPDHAVIVHEIPSKEYDKRMRYSEWPGWLRHWRVKVYALGILLTMLSVVTDFAYTPLQSVLRLHLVVGLAFGVYVGMKEIHQPEWRILHIVGLLAGILTGLVGYTYALLGDMFDWVPVPMERFVRLIEEPNILVDVPVTYVFGTWLVFISGVLLGRGVQQKAEQERWGAQNVADASVQQGQATRALPARTATLLGIFGVLAAALIQSIATVLAAILGRN